MNGFQFGYNLENNKSLLFFVGVASETDHLPFGDVRKKWSHDALAEKDKEIKTTEDYYMNNAKIACRELIKLFEGSP
ncbi:MAG: hypothetical protein A2921_03080 [Candidatus Magasanikbacteria bacterium RIFCSPLOWO2_01_FULL_43_20b]|uniref:Uncharacterized protein n=1 Tax=Candidatus Magasanikbacteria bacterium RIFCSPLOWO2_12_FULL_43_12 TaxID=1798692 RepID=A0A1F6MVR8_9BACT|nr:MAG: hypothetical protein A3C74_04445 [Candidatus Magasanikbacteria bacterium RIFCSPHIGHO2_02_FULL_44_13]OGH71883.1 MAG: hypothetical protein A3I93_01985 [Candidatus Magasanikbacteria bacterium RIFCSPLOWO2_02_FULL_43_22]OGH72859.1 MAG: hypothetical protein A2921_03080 [Candidatus Magasanikbacteria bacterium RIFCSPLOWO2_01_FULL_43_20b]OGH75759.1 MAG: hypothetical protein A3G00_03315 [Candidatus Magasanikbacteria bacterium RIFCSPLOWO2_12_FULL_43_12]